PQKIAAANSTRSGLMAKKLGVAVLGVVENMSTGEVSKNTEEVAAALQTEVLGTIKADPAFNAFSDSGRIQVLENGEIYGIFERIVSRIVSG
ncbi:MAG: P-loop NTPase, partial [Candidatus Micrarchaeaceae archaeon]